MGVRFFISEEALARLMETEGAALDGSALSMPGRKLAVDVTEAVYVLREVAGEPDKADLVGKVRSVESLATAGADYYRGSVIVGDNAYDVVEGYLGIADEGWTWPDGRAAPVAASPPVEAEAGARKRPRSESTGFRAPGPPPPETAAEKVAPARRARPSVPPKRPSLGPAADAEQAVDDLEKILLDTVKTDKHR